MPAFIETQFPIARLSAESYKERKATNSQTLTGLGRWWGRKPLILVRASILGMLMHASNDVKKMTARFFFKFSPWTMLERYSAGSRRSALASLN